MVKKPEQFGRVAVLMGGTAAERPISLKSGKAVYDALIQQGVDAVAVDITGDFVNSLKELNVDRVFNVIHGRGGEDGIVQAILESLSLPYTGSGVLASALAMDKLRTKLCWRGYGLSTPDWSAITHEGDLANCAEQLGFPLIVKPALEGSSIGISKADNYEQLVQAWTHAAQYKCDVYAERWIKGCEYTVGLLQGEALPVIRLETPHSFYDFEAKYLAETTKYHCPAGLNEQDEQGLRKLAVQAAEALGVKGWARVDVFIDEQGQYQLIEINTVPGMTDHSLVPMAAKQAGIDFAELVLRILATSLV